MTSPVLAINKCVDDVGKVVYQSAPCPATAKGSEITLQKAPPVPVASPVDAEELKRIQQTANAMERERKLTHLVEKDSSTVRLLRYGGSTQERPSSMKR